VRIDPDGVPDWVARRLRAAGAVITEAADPCLLPKATKTARELAGMRSAHVRDGAALTRFLAWLSMAAPSGGVSEIAAAERLAAFRAENERYRGPSFPTISAAGANGAIVHYRVSPSSDRLLTQGELYLVDSGGQYLDGTTDVTRTVVVGEATAEMRQRFTLVLKGHIAIATARFPRGTTGSQLDALARQAMWRAGLDYDHGTGHGVGYYLGVHEGPQRISKLPSGIPLQPGMIVSNEPGYYKPGAYGIRIENLVAVCAVETPPGGDQDLLGFETLTLAPIDRSLIDLELLDRAELAWLDEYHARVREMLAPLVDDQTRRWLYGATRSM
jgi:Xaa-Pro aminopeptidase